MSTSDESVAGYVKIPKRKKRWYIRGDIRIPLFKSHIYKSGEQIKELWKENERIRYNCKCDVNQQENNWTTIDLTYSHSHYDVHSYVFCSNSPL